MSMRSLFQWLMVFCVMAGVSARAVSADAGRILTCSHSVEKCCGDHHDSDVPDTDHGDEDHCPADHHHHHHCCSSFAQPLAVENTLTCRLGVVALLLFGVSHESEIAPEEPFLSSEKPPLI